MDAAASARRQLRNGFEAGLERAAPMMRVEKGAGFCDSKDVMKLETSFLSLEKKRAAMASADASPLAFHRVMEVIAALNKLPATSAFRRRGAFGEAMEHCPAIIDTQVMVL